MAKDEPNRVGVGVGVPAPRTCIFVISLVSPPEFRDSKIVAEEQAKFSRNLTDCTRRVFVVHRGAENGVATADFFTHLFCYLVI
jgi:hypothetical protein